MERFSAAEPGGELHDGRELPAGRRVRGEEPGDPGEDQRALLRSVRPRVRLPDTRLEHLVPVEPGVFGEQRMTERSHHLGAVTATAHESEHDRTGAVDLALRVPARRELREVTGRVAGTRAAGTLRKRSRYTRSAPCTMPRISSGVGLRTTAWCSALAAVNA